MAWNGVAAAGQIEFSSPVVTWSDRTGSWLLVIQPRDGSNRLGVLTGNTVMMDRNILLPSQPQGYNQLQSTLQHGSTPLDMTW